MCFSFLMDASLTTLRLTKAQRFRFEESGFAEQGY